MARRTRDSCCFASGSRPATVSLDRLGSPLRRGESTATFPAFTTTPLAAVAAVPLQSLLDLCLLVGVEHLHDIVVELLLELVAGATTATTAATPVRTIAAASAATTTPLGAGFTALATTAAPPLGAIFLSFLLGFLEGVVEILDLGLLLGRQLELIQGDLEGARIDGRTATTTALVLLRPKRLECLDLVGIQILNDGLLQFLPSRLHLLSQGGRAFSLGLSSFLHLLADRFQGIGVAIIACIAHGLAEFAELIHVRRIRSELLAEGARLLGVLLEELADRILLLVVEIDRFGHPLELSLGIGAAPALEPTLATASSLSLTVSLTASAASGTVVVAAALSIRGLGRAETGGEQNHER